MKSYVMEDGRFHHRLRQSWVKTADICAERARLEHFDLMEDVESDAASVGTAVHAAIEVCLSEHHEGQALTRADTVGLFHDAFSGQMALPAFRWIKYDEPKARAFGEKCAGDWHDEVLPTLPESALLEHEFLVTLTDDAERLIELSGTIDYCPTIAGDKLRDWKTAGRAYQPWEWKRWAVQPTMYSYAAAELGFVAAGDVIPFEYVVMSPKGVQRFDVHRGPQDWSWMTDKLTTLALLIEADLPAWMKSDNHALCSSAWCPAFKACKGQHYDEGWPHAA